MRIIPSLDVRLAGRQGDLQISLPGSVSNSTSHDRLQTVNCTQRAQKSKNL